MRFQREPVTIDLINELIPLLVEHNKEVGDTSTIEPNIEMFLGLEAAGHLRCFTARIDSTDELVGYNVYFVQNSLHKKTSLQALQDVIFIRKGHRGFGLQFISWCDEQLRYDRVNVIYGHVKAAHDFGPMLEKLGYELVDLIYKRELQYEKATG
jgi:hypothetical protein